MKKTWEHRHIFKNLEITGLKRGGIRTPPPPHTHTRARMSVFWEQFRTTTTATDYQLYFGGLFKISGMSENDATFQTFTNLSSRVMLYPLIPIHISTQGCRNAIRCIIVSCWYLYKTEAWGGGWPCLRTSTICRNFQTKVTNKHCKSTKYL